MFKALSGRIELEEQAGAAICSLSINNRTLDDGYWHNIELTSSADLANFSLRLDNTFESSSSYSSNSQARFTHYDWSIGGCGGDRDQEPACDMAHMQGLLGCVANVRLNGLPAHWIAAVNSSNSCPSSSAAASSSSVSENNICVKHKPCFNNATCVATLTGASFRCECPLGFKGAYCQHVTSGATISLRSAASSLQNSTQQCPPRWWGGNELTGGGGMCGPCECDEARNFAAECDRHTGRCHCKDNYYLKRFGANNDGNDDDERCVPCDCDLDGSASLRCDRLTGQCACVAGAGITGRRCDQCVAPLAEMQRQPVASSQQQQALVQCRQMSDSECPRARRASLWWPRTPMGARAALPCPHRASGTAYRYCSNHHLGNSAGGWLNHVDLSECQSSRSAHNVDDGGVLTSAYEAYKLTEEMSRVVHEAAARHDDSDVEDEAGVGLFARDLLHVHRLLRLVVDFDSTSSSSSTSFSMPLYLQDRHFVGNVLDVLDQLLSARYELRTHQQQLLNKSNTTANSTAQSMILDTLVSLQTYLSSMARNRDVEQQQPTVISDVDLANVQFRFRSTRCDQLNLPTMRLAIEATTTTATLALAALNIQPITMPHKLAVHLPSPHRIAASPPPLRLLVISSHTYQLVSHLLVISTMSSSSSTTVSVEFVLARHLEAVYDARRGHIVYRPLRMLNTDGGGGYRCAQLDAESRVWTPASQATPVSVSGNTVKCSFTLTSSSSSALDSSTSLIAGVIAPVAARSRSIALGDLSEDTINEDEDDNGDDDTVAVRFTLVARTLSAVAVALVGATLVGVLAMGACRRRTCLQAVQAHVCLVSLLVMFMYVACVNSNASPLTCRSVALVQHYAHMSVYAWLLCATLHLYRMLTELHDINKPGTSARPPLFYYALGYALPAIVCSLTLAIRPDMYTNLYSSSSSSSSSSSTHLDEVFTIFAKMNGDNFKYKWTLKISLLFKLVKALKSIENSKNVAF